MRVNSVISATLLPLDEPDQRSMRILREDRNVCHSREVNLDGLWTVERVGGVLPPMNRVRKEIQGDSGVTLAGPLRMRFDVRGNELRYRAPFVGLVDFLEPAEEGWSGRATWFGREFGRFRMSRAAA